MAITDQVLPMPSEIFDAFFPNYAQRVAVGVVVDAYAKAHQECEAMFEPPERNDVTAIVRRGFIEQDLREAMMREKLNAKAVKNSKGTSSHTKVTIGRVVLTESCVHSVNEMVRDAEFRSAYSATPQLHLLEDDDVDDEAAVYAILIHGPHPDFPEQPGFVHVVFPSPDLEYYQDRIDILSRFPEVVGRLRGWEKPEEIHPSESEPRKDHDQETGHTGEGR